MHPSIPHYAKGVLCVLLMQLAAASPSSPSEAQDYPLTVLSHFTQPAIFENIAVKADGQLLVTSTQSPHLFQVSPFHDNVHRLIATIPHTQGLTGIAELEEDVFFIAASNITAESKGVPGSNVIWKVDLRNTSPTNLSSSDKQQQQQKPRTRKVEPVANLTTAGLWNGLCRLGSSLDIILVADSADGEFFKVNTTTGSYDAITMLDKRGRPSKHHPDKTTGRRERHPHPRLIPLIHEPQPGDLCAVPHLPGHETCEGSGRDYLA